MTKGELAYSKSTSFPMMLKCETLWGGFYNSSSQIFEVASSTNGDPIEYCVVIDVKLMGIPSISKLGGYYWKHFFHLFQRNWETIDVQDKYFQMKNVGNIVWIPSFWLMLVWI